MKVKALIDCIGDGYDFKADETGEVTQRVADLLISFNYVVEVKETKKSPRSKKVAE